MENEMLDKPKEVKSERWIKRVKIIHDAPIKSVEAKYEALIRKIRDIDGYIENVNSVYGADLYQLDVFYHIPESKLEEMDIFLATFELIRGR